MVTTVLLQPGTHQCSPFGKCTNEVGGYSCECYTGFEGDGKNCQDMDECAENKCGANAICTNTVGMFVKCCVIKLQISGKHKLTKLKQNS